MAFCIIFIFLSAVLTKIYCLVAYNTRLMDKPNERSLHLTPTVRGGGLVFIGLSLSALPFLCYFTNTPIYDVSDLIISIALLAAVSFLDDLYQLSASSRFLIQFLVALLLIIFMKQQTLDFVLFSLSHQLLIIPFLILGIIWAINHFNFMDGLDGYCASQSIFLFSAYALLFHFHNALLYQDFCFIIIFSLMGFLIFNFPPAKLFMGDIGSATLGFISFYLALVAQQKFQIPILYWFVLNGLFMFDSSITLLRRFIKKEKWYAPHRKHAYQRIKQYGISTRMILLGQVVLNTLFLSLVLLFQHNMFHLIWLLLLPYGLMFGIYIVLEKLFPMFLES